MNPREFIGDVIGCLCLGIIWVGLVYMTAAFSPEQTITSHMEMIQE